jgi:hypothetical protein
MAEEKFKARFRRRLRDRIEEAEEAQEEDPSFEWKEATKREALEGGYLID